MVVLGTVLILAMAMAMVRRHRSSSNNKHSSMAPMVSELGF